MDYASILVVDDEEMIVFFFKMILEEIGYDVKEAFCGEEAIKTASTQHIDLAILDYKLSDMPGDIVATKLKEINEQTKVVFVTGQVEARDRILRSNLSRHVVVKPIREDELIETVENVLGERTVSALV